MKRFFDSHSHLQEIRFDGDRDAVLFRASCASVRDIVVCGEDLKSSEAAVELAQLTDTVRILPTVGFHPHEAEKATPSALRELQGLAGEPDVVALGEIGLDFYRELVPRAKQRRVLDAQLEIAALVGLPVCVHSRGAESHLVEPLGEFAAASPLRESGRPLGVMHAFGGTLEQAQLYVDLGFLISFACSAGYPGNTQARRVVAELPLEMLLIETDSPALPPQDQRGTRNEPANVIAAAKVIATVRGESIETIAAATALNGELLLLDRVVGGASS